MGKTVRVLLKSKMKAKRKKEQSGFTPGHFSEEWSFLKRLMVLWYVPSDQVSFMFFVLFFFPNCW